MGKDEFGPMQRIPISNDSDSSESTERTHKSKRSVYGHLFNVTTAVMGGLYLGFSAPSVSESCIYCLILLIESIVCFFGGIYGPSLAVRKVFAGFVIYLVIAGLTTPVASWISEHIV